MNATLIKLAAAAVIAIAAIVGIAHMTGNTAEITPPEIETVAQQMLTGPMTHEFADGSTIALAEGASIRTFAQADKRGFEHLAGQIDVTVAKGKGEFIVTTPYGEVKALGTQFKLDLIDGVAQNTREPVRLLAVEVEEGKVQVSNAKGSSVVQAQQKLVVAADQQPYDFNQDTKLPAELRRRITSMVGAFKAGDPAVWASNFNMSYIYKLGKGEAAYDPNLFGGSAEDAERIKQAIAQVKSLDEMKQMFLSTININEPVEVYVRRVELSKDSEHARAECVQRKSGNHMVITTPQWHYFDNAWWQIDD